MVQDVTNRMITPPDDDENLSTAIYLSPDKVVDSAELSVADNIAALSGIIRAVDSPLRTRMLVALHERPHYVSELVALVGSSQPLVSQHLKVLKAAGLVHADRRGRQMSYSLAQPMIIDILKLALRIAEKTAETASE